MAKKKSSVGCLFWVALILLVLVIFLFNRNTIETVLDRTGLMNYLSREKQPETSPDVEVVVPDSEPETVAIDSGNTGDGEEGPVVEPDSTIVVEEKPKQEEPATPQPPVQSEPTSQVRRSKLYFVYIDGNSTISLREVTRPISFTDSPLTDTLQSLLKGLSSSELSKGLLSLVPEGTQIRSVAVRGDTAYIDFNESFRFNTFGREGYRYQLEQIIYTATEFQTVHNVQILIDGERLSYLGPESPFVGEPLSRDSLVS